MAKQVLFRGAPLAGSGVAQPLAAGAVQSVVRHVIDWGRKSARRGFVLALTLGGLTTGELKAEVADPPAAELTDAEPAAPTVAERADNPYRAIVVRNAFGLKEPVPPPEPPPPAPVVPETPKLDVKIAGVGEIAGVRYAYLMVPDTDRPGQFLYPALTDDPQRGRVRHSSGIEIREIDLKAQSVRLVNGGIETTLSLLENGVGAAPGASGAGAKTAAGAIPAPGKAPVRPALTRGATVVPSPAQAGSPAASAEPLVFSRNRNRANAANNSFTPGDSAGGGGGVVPLPAASAASVLAGGGNLPSRPLRTTPDGGSSGSAAPAPAIPLAEQYQILVRQRQAADAAGIPLPPIPGLPMPTDPQPLVPAQ